MSIQYTADQLQRKLQVSAESPGFARLADVLRCEGRLEEAIQLCQDGLRLRPQQLTGCVVLGKCLVDSGRLEEAREQFETALRLDARCLSALHFLAHIMEKLQWQEAAAGYYRSILAVEPWDSEIRALLGPPQTAKMPLSEYPQAPPHPRNHRADPAPASAEPEAPAGKSPGEVIEFNINNAADYLPQEDTESLSEGLEEINLEDVTEFKPASSQAPIFESARQPETGPTLYTDSPAGDDRSSPTPDYSGATEALDDEPPISGQDVEDRLDSLFGLTEGDDFQNKPAKSNFQNQALESNHDFDGVVSGRDVEDRLDSLFDGGETGAIPQNRDAEKASPAGAEDRVEGVDIEKRLDDLFSLSPEAEAPALFGQPAETSSVPEPDSVVSPFSETGGETAFASIPEDYSDAATQADQLQEGITGQDVADKLDALFGEDSAPGAASATSWAPQAPFHVDSGFPAAAPVDPEAGRNPGITGADIEDQLDRLFQLDDPKEDNIHETVSFDVPASLAFDGEPLGGENMPGDEQDLTLVMPAMKEPVADDPATGVDPAYGGNPPLNPDPPAVDWLAGNGQSPPSRGMELPDGLTGSETLVVPVDEFSAGGGSGTQMVDSSDLGRRLDQMFGEEVQEPSAAPGAAAEVARSAEVQGDSGIGEGAAPQDLELFARDPVAGTFPGLQDQAPAPETVVSGDDISSRLAEMFEPDGDGDAVPTQAIPSPWPAWSRGDEDSLGPTVDLKPFLPEPELKAQPLPEQELEEETGEAPRESASFGAPQGVGEVPGTVGVAPSDAGSDRELAPLTDEDEGYPEEEAVPEGAGANVATVTLAEIYFQQGLKEQALQIYRQLLEREPGNDSVRKRIQEIEATQSEGDNRDSDSDHRRPRPGLKVPKRKK